MNWLKHYFWFIRESSRFLNCSFAQFVAKGGLEKAYHHANYMVKYDKLTPEQKEYLYLTEDRTMHFD